MLNGFPGLPGFYYVKPTHIPEVTDFNMLICCSETDNSGGPSPSPTDPTAVPDRQAGRCDQVIRREGLDSGTVVGIAFAAFIIGVALTAALWFIHTHTGRFREGWFQ